MYQESDKYLYLLNKYVIWKLNIRKDYKDRKRYMQENVPHNAI